MESYCGIEATLLIYYPLNSVVRTLLSEFPLQPFNVYDHILFKLSDSSVIITTMNTGDDSKTIFLYRCWGHPEDFDSGSRQRWWCGLSGVGVKATSDPWLTWRTPTITTVSSEKRLCGYVQNLESTSHITACPVSHQANGGADISVTVNAEKAVCITLLRVVLLHVTGCFCFSSTSQYGTGCDHICNHPWSKLHFAKFYRAITLCNGPRQWCIEIKFKTFQIKNQCW